MGTPSQQPPRGLFLRSKDQSRRILSLGAFEGDGKDGDIYRDSDPNAVVKYYKDQNPNHLIRAAQKLTAMLHNVPRGVEISDADTGKSYVQIAWPSALIEKNDGTVVGFQMPLVDRKRATDLKYVLQPLHRREHKIDNRFHFRLVAAYNLASVVGKLHDAGHHIIDLKPENIKIYSDSGYIAVLDCDGFSIRAQDGQKYPTDVATPGYIAPEVQQQPNNLNEFQDRFALAVIIFQLLNEGLHPFRGKPRPGYNVPDTEQGRIDAALPFPYGKIPPAQLTPDPQSLHRWYEDETMLMFERAFGRAADRPTPEEWRHHISLLLPKGKLGLRMCSESVGHLKFSRGCAHCSLLSELGHYPWDFPPVTSKPAAPVAKASGPSVATPLAGVGAQSTPPPPQQQPSPAIATTSTYQSALAQFGAFAGASAGALAGLAVGFIPCWVVSGVIGYIWRGNAGWDSFWWLWIGSSIAGILNLWQSGRSWVASRSHDRAEVITKGSFIGGLCSVLAALFVFHFIGQSNVSPIGNTNSPTTLSFTNVEFVQSMQNGQPIGPSTQFAAPASPVLYSTYVNGRAGVDNVGMTVWSGTNEISHCNDFTIQYQDGNYFCPVSNTPLYAGSYDVQLIVNGQVLGSYSFTVTSPPAQETVSTQPSFDCGRARKWAETTVCNAPALADQDQQMAALYKGLIANAAQMDRGALRASQRQWIEARDQCQSAGDPMNCLTSVYASRIAALSGGLASAEAQFPTENTQQPPAAPMDAQVGNAAPQAILPSIPRPGFISVPSIPGQQPVNRVPPGQPGGDWSGLDAPQAPPRTAQFRFPQVPQHRSKPVLWRHP